MPMPSEDLRPDGSGAMFDHIAADYDRLNRLMSLGRDRAWRRVLVDEVARAGKLEAILDVATGTGDVLLTLRQRHRDARLVGVDPSRAMLDLARRKLDAVAATHGLFELVQGEAAALPFADSTFDAVTIAFGLRNFADRPAALAELGRVLRPGGVLSILELTEPRGFFAPAARLHVHHVVPRLGAWLSRGPAYQYLSSSIAAFPPPEEVVTLLDRAGFVSVTRRSLALGSVCVFAARTAVRGELRPEAQENGVGVGTIVDARA